MKQIDFYLDFISPYAYLAFEELPHALQGLSYSVRYKPVLFGAMLKQLGQLGPAEIPGKREWTYRQVLWLAHCKGVALQLPATHPFNPLSLLRLATACEAAGEPNRFVCETVFRHVWTGGAEAADAQRTAALQQQLAPARDPNADSVKQQLKAHTDEALAAGVFGVPAMVVDGRVFWGQDSLPMLRAYLEGDAWFIGEAWNAAAQLQSSVQRRAG